MTGEVILDLSRLISRADRSTPTGIDRVELAYARHLIDSHGDRTRFAAMTPLGRVGALPRAAAIRYVEALGHLWEQGSVRGPDVANIGRALTLYALRDGEAGLTRGRRRGERAAYLLVSHHHLDRPASIRRVLKVTGARFVPLVHDLIPIQLPEYNRPGHDAKHMVRMTAVAELADTVIVNSEDTGAALRPFLDKARRSPALLCSALGVDVATPASGAPRSKGEAPYFVCISTIEPRKNHLLLFNIWRRMAQPGGDPPPHLHLVGHRGWHNEAALDVIDRSTSVRPHLTEHRTLSDRDMAGLLAGARALLMPSFAEGYGLPVGEALAAGVPVLCSDLATLRGVGGEAPDYLDPLDGLAWLNAVRDYARPDSPRRAAQLARVRDWSAPTWEAHFERVDPVLFGAEA